jgi:hypothetical protein
MKLSTALTVAIAFAAAAEATFAGLLWRLQWQYYKQQRRTSVLVALELRRPDPGKLQQAFVRFENASPMGVHVRYLEIVPRGKEGRTAEPIRRHLQIAIGDYDSRAFDLTDDILRAAHLVDSKSAPEGSQRAAAIRLTAHYRPVGGKRIRGREVNYLVEYSDSSVLSAEIIEED